MMRYKTIQLLRCLTVCAVLCFSTSVSAQDIRWGGVVNPGGGSGTRKIFFTHLTTVTQPSIRH